MEGAADTAAVAVIAAGRKKGTRMNVKRVALIGLIVAGAAFLLAGCGRHWGPGWGHCGYAPNGQQYAGHAPVNGGYGYQYYGSAVRTNN